VDILNEGPADMGASNTLTIAYEADDLVTVLKGL